MTRRFTAMALSLTLVGAGAVAIATAPAAWAYCPPDGPTTIYTVHNIATHRTATGLHSDWIKGPATITRVQSATTTKTITGGGSVSGGFDLWVVKVNAGVSGSIAKSWSHTAGWNYTKPVPAHRTARMMYFHRTVTFTVTEKQWDPGHCGFRTVTTAHVRAPLHQNSYDVWDLQYK